MDDDKPIRLTRGVCRDLRLALRAASKETSVVNLSAKEYDAWGRVEAILSEEQKAGTVRGGRILCKRMSYKDDELLHVIFRDLMLTVLKDCTQMQVRSALKKHIAVLDEWSGTSAVESLGRIVEMRVA